MALPDIAADVGGGLVLQQWVVAGFLLALGSLLLAGGALGDVYDRWRVLATGTAVFGAAAAMTALAPAAGVLIAGRLLQGVGAALMLPSVLAVLTTSFAGPERSRAIGRWTAWSGLSIIAGPALGGVLTEAFSWRAIYAVLVPLSAVVVVLVLRAAPPPAPPRVGVRLDGVGALLAMPAVGGPAFALIQAPALGWGDPLVLGALAVGVAAMAAFVGWERRTAHPLLPLHLFADRDFVVLNVVTFVLYGALISFGTYTVLFLNGTAGYPATAAGLVAAVPMIVLFVLSSRFGALADRYHPRAFVAGGAVVAGIGLLLLVRADAGAPFLGVVLPSVLVHGVGLAMAVPALTAAVLSAAGQEHAGIASGINNSVARIGSLLGIAVIGGLVLDRFSATVERATTGRELDASTVAALDRAREQPLGTGAGAPVVAQLTTDGAVEAFRLGIRVIGALAVLAGLIVMVGLRGRGRTFTAAGVAPGCLLDSVHRDVVDGGGR